jgi:serine/threonine protein kinase
VERGLVTEPQALIADRYRLLRRVGSGGMGVVWEAWDERLERRIAAKQLYRPLGASPEEAEQANQRAMREARLAARLQHPHAVPVFDVAEQDGQLWLILQFVPSVTLAAALEEVGPLHPDEAGKVGAQIASALAAAHAAGIVHRDVKPGNILIAEDGTALISDFGISRALGDATLTSSGMIHGTPAYLAPEVARGGEANFASDVFSLGATLYSAMEGAPPFGTDDNTMALLHRVASGLFARPEHSGALTPVILHMLSVDPDERPSMAAVADSFAKLAASTQTVAQSTQEMAITAGTHAPTTSNAGPSTGSEAESSATQPRRHRVLAATLAIIALLGIGILTAVVLLEGRSGPNPTAGSGPSNSTVSASTTPSTARQSEIPSASSSSPRAPTSPQRHPSAKASPRTKAPTSSPTSAPTVRGAPTAGQLRNAITSYYALLPRNTDAAWPRMTASYQTNHAGGRQAYQRFWDAIDKVVLTDVRGSSPDSAQATITYYFKDGRVVRERTAYGLLDERGRLKINSSTVLNSTTL